jgi:hypothetical protein
MTVGFLYTVVSYWPLRLSRRKISQLHRDILCEIREGTADEREVMIIEGDLAAILPKIKSVKSKMEHFFVLRPIYDQLSKLYAEMSDVRTELTEYLYPDADQDLTQEQGMELIEAFKSWNENVHAESLDNG